MANILIKNKMLHALCHQENANEYAFRMAPVKNVTTPSADAGQEQQEFFLVLVGTQKGTVSLGDRMLPKREYAPIFSPYDLAIMLLEILRFTQSS
jgi:hypothetical protein